jgi:hypothetical protein
MNVLLGLANISPTALSCMLRSLRFAGVFAALGCELGNVENE